MPYGIPLTVNTFSLIVFISTEGCGIGNEDIRYEMVVDPNEATLYPLARIQKAAC
ncbi:MAG: hypothetical protein ACQEUK_00480 [Pseudomonadota bacterium]